MKYWRGYLVAAILALCSWGLIQFAQSHWMLVDMVYPYVTRMVQMFLAQWSADLSFCLWQLAILVFGVGVLASIVLMIVLKWNPIQWFGWVLVLPSLVFLLHTGIYGLNAYTGPIAEDIRLNVTDYAMPELEQTTLYFQKQANALASQVSRDTSGDAEFKDLQALAVQADEGFKVLTYEQHKSVFATSSLLAEESLQDPTHAQSDSTFAGLSFPPVKTLGWTDLLTSKGVTGILVPLTGEAAINPQIPDVGLPFAICRLMANQRCIANDQDSALAAFLACTANTSVEFQYSGFLMAYRYCCSALESMPAQQQLLQEIRKTESALLRQDLNTYNSSFAVAADHGFAEELDSEKYGDTPPLRSNVVDLLVSWYIQEIILPMHVEEEVEFDPLDETQVDLTGLPNYKPTEPIEAE